MRRVLLVLLAGALVVPASSSAATRHTIRTDGGFVARIGDFRPKRDARLSAAIRAFGQPSSAKGGGNVCTVRWNRLRLKITFANFGLAPPGLTTCSPSVGRAQSFVARGSRIRTWEGLRPGMPSSSVLARHRSAEFREGSWWLRIATSPFGDNSEYAVVGAIVGGGRVRALTGWIGGAGE